MNLRRAALRLFTATNYVVTAMVFLPSLPMPSGHAEDARKTSVIASAATIADGRPWNMEMVEGQQKFKLTLMPNGTGIMESSTLAPELSWWQSADRLCIRPSTDKGEHCVTLLVRDGGYDAVENDALFFRLRR
jgi:hypothetical protein